MDRRATLIRGGGVQAVVAEVVSFERRISPAFCER